MATRLISTTPEEALPPNGLRKSFLIQNQDSVINVFIKKEKPGNTTVSATDHDFRIGPLNSFVLNSDVDGLESIQERYTIVAASGTPRIAVFETESIKR